MKAKCCKNCAFLDIEEAQDKAGRVRDNKFAACNWISTELWPESVTSTIRPRGSIMKATEGKECACFILKKDLENKKIKNIVIKAING